MKKISLKNELSKRPPTAKEVKDAQKLAKKSGKLTLALFEAKSLFGTESNVAFIKGKVIAGKSL